MCRDPAADETDLLLRACQSLGYPIKRVFLDLAGRIGHCFCAAPSSTCGRTAARGRLARATATR
ncbi:hypothetical protein ACPC54_12055 [Kitasatospora sp. NPDC094028]